MARRLGNDHRLLLPACARRRVLPHLADAVARTAAAPQTSARRDHGALRRALLPAAAAGAAPSATSWPERSRSRSAAAGARRRDRRRRRPRPGARRLAHRGDRRDPRGARRERRGQELAAQGDRGRPRADGRLGAHPRPAARRAAGPRARAAARRPARVGAAALRLPRLRRRRARPLPPPGALRSESDDDRRAIARAVAIAGIDGPLRADQRAVGGRAAARPARARLAQEPSSCCSTSRRRTSTRAGR